MRLTINEANHIIQVYNNKETHLFTLDDVSVPFQDLTIKAFQTLLTTKYLTYITKCETILEIHTDYKPLLSLDTGSTVQQSYITQIHTLNKYLQLIPIQDIFILNDNTFTPQKSHFFTRNYSEKVDTFVSVDELIREE